MIDFASAKEKLTLEEKIGQLFMPAAYINDTENEIQAIEHLIKKHTIGGICFFHSRASAATNYEGKKEVIYNKDSLEVLKSLIHRYQKAAKYPLLIAIDAEWGLAMRIENTPQYPYGITLGAIKDNTSLVYQVGKQIAKDCKAAGIHWNLSPVVDINNNPNNPVIGYRSFGDDKHNVLKLAKAYVNGTESEGILTSIKHFPGHGDTATDSHLGLPVIEKSKGELLDNELFPFQKLINEGVDAVMVGHLSVPSITKNAEVPSSINKDIITDLLRNEMGFKGVVISDALNMHAVSKNYPNPGELEWLAFDAGNDVLCFAEHIEEGVEMILNKASEVQINKSLERIWRLKKKAFENSDIKKNLTNPDALNREIAEQSITLQVGTADTIAAFRDRDFCTLTFKRYSTEIAEEEIRTSISEMRAQVAEEEDILLLLTPPQIKPANNFGFMKSEIDFINDLLQNKKVVLYHFGNPYALALFDISKTIATVIVYQDFKVFQNVATEHFLGTIEAKGKLPFKLEV